MQCGVNKMIDACEESTNEGVDDGFELVKNLLNNFSVGSDVVVIPLLLQHLQCSESFLLSSREERKFNEFFRRSTTEQERIDTAVKLFQVASSALLKRSIFKAG